MPPALGSRPAAAPSFEALLRRPGLPWMGQNSDVTPELDDCANVQPPVPDGKPVVMLWPFRGQRSTTTD